MKTKMILFYAILVLLGGCIPIMSIDSFFTESDKLFEEKLLGTWEDDSNDPDTNWIFSRYEKDPNKTYKLMFIDKEGKKGSYIAILMKLDKTLFLDIYPDQMPWDTKDPNNVEFVYNTLFLIPANTILKVDSIEPKLILRMTKTNKFEELIKAHPDAIQFKKIEGTIVLTSSTKELQVFILKYANDENLFPDEIILKRKTAQTSKP
jgi:hypothetical protein